MGTIFTQIWRVRLEKIVEGENMLGEMQGGFRKNRSTMDNLFTITTLMEKAHKHNQTLFLAFIDLRKAFDRVPREQLWEVLAHLGFGGKFLRIVEGLYNNHKRKIKVGATLTDFIDCNIGVKQGCVLSPILFAIYMIELSKKLRAEFFRQDNFSIQHVDTFVHLSTHIGDKDIKFTCYHKRS